jgi:hypothetical protein
VGIDQLSDSISPDLRYAIFTSDIIEHDIEPVGTEQPRGQSMIVYWPVELGGILAFYYPPLPTKTPICSYLFVSY